MDKNKFKTILLLHLLLMLYSTSGIFSKLAAVQPFLSIRFCMYYGVIIVLLGVYAIAWQQIIKRLPLTVAFANKAITIVWSVIWGSFFFHEHITVGKIIGGILVIVGVIVFVTDEKEEFN